jgi:hypothetical protein
VATRLLGLWVRIQLGAWKSVCCECCVLSGKSLCVELITCPEESYRAWCVSECDGEAMITRGTWTIRGCCALEKKKLHRVKEYGSIDYYRLLSTKTTVMPVTKVPGIRLRCLLFLSASSQTSVPLTDFTKKNTILKFHENCSSGNGIYHRGRRHRHKKANSHIVLINGSRLCT